MSVRRQQNAVAKYKEEQARRIAAGGAGHDLVQGVPLEDPVFETAIFDFQIRYERVEKHPDMSWNYVLALKFHGHLIVTLMDVYADAGQFVDWIETHEVFIRGERLPDFLMRAPRPACIADAMGRFRTRRPEPGLSKKATSRNSKRRRSIATVIIWHVACPPGPHRTTMSESLAIGMRFHGSAGRAWRSGAWWTSRPSLRRTAGAVSPCWGWDVSRHEPGR